MARLVIEIRAPVVDGRDNGPTSDEPGEASHDISSEQMGMYYVNVIAANVIDQGDQNVEVVGVVLVQLSYRETHGAQVGHDLGKGPGTQSAHVEIELATVYPHRKAIDQPLRSGVAQLID